MASNTIHEFQTREALADALAGDVAQVLSAALDARGQALLAVSGGSTPALFFERLSLRGIDWSSVTVTLVDERFVPPASSRSNERLVRETLLRNAAAVARFVALYSDTGTVEAAAQAADEAIGGLALPFDAVVLGMGGDGHTASLFPDTTPAELAAPGIVLPIRSAHADEPRLTLSLKTIAQSGALFLHIEGDEKRDVLEHALAGDGTLPIRAVFDAAPGAVATYWTGQERKAP